MQTFLPLPSFAESAATLDRLRLGKQRVETLQIMTALVEGRGWVHHPATRMWAGYEHALLMYQQAVCDEWLIRRGRDTCYVKTADVYYDGLGFNGPREAPPWLGVEAFHISHQSNLVRKDPDWYEPQFPGVPDDIEYFWPTKEGFICTSTKESRAESRRRRTSSTAVSGPFRSVA